MSGLVYRSTVLSLAAQLLLGAVASIGFFLPIPEAYRADLQLILAIELGSQIVELLWYTVVVCRYNTITTWTRYIDWVISTPIMLVSTVFFFRHRSGDPLVLVFERPTVYILLSLNWLMLLFGFLAERKQLSKMLALALGGAAFVGSFTLLATFVKNVDVTSLAVFWTMYVVWGLYGVAAALADTPKNVFYNGLDIVSKNFYGLFLTVYAIYLE